MAATVGLTGGIACGKSAVAQVFRELGVPVIDADAVAREIVAPRSEALAEIVRAFGLGYLLPDGSLDRKKLGDHIFADDEARKALNAITHPRIAAESGRRLAAPEVQSCAYAIYEAALLVENSLHRHFAALIVVSATLRTQERRLMRRDGISAQAARARIAAQMPLDMKTAVADYVIDNDGDIESMRNETLRVHEALVARLPKVPA